MFFQELYTIVSPYLEKSTDADAEDKDDAESSLELKEAIITSLGLAWPEAMDTQKKYIIEMLDRLVLFVFNKICDLHILIIK